MLLLVPGILRLFPTFHQNAILALLEGPPYFVSTHCHVSCHVSSGRWKPLKDSRWKVS